MKTRTVPRCGHTETTTAGRTIQCINPAGQCESTSRDPRGRHHFVFVDGERSQR